MCEVSSAKKLWPPVSNKCPLITLTLFVYTFLIVLQSKLFPYLSNNGYSHCQFDFASFLLYRPNFPRVTINYLIHNSNERSISSVTSNKGSFPNWSHLQIEWYAQLAAFTVTETCKGKEFCLWWWMFTFGGSESSQATHPSKLGSIHSTFRTSLSPMGTCQAFPHHLVSNIA